MFVVSRAVARRAAAGLAPTIKQSKLQRAWESGSAAPLDKLVIFDTTLRDGEQSPGCTLQIHEKVAIAHQLSLLGVDVCEAGFPIASPGDFEAVSMIAREVGCETGHRVDGQPMVIAGLARAKHKDIDVCYEAIKAAPRHRIHTFLATSDIHLKHKLNMTRAEAIAHAVAMVSHARSMCADVEFSAEDAGRSDRAFLCEILGAVIEAGARTINVPDTVGYTVPQEYGGLFAHLIAHTPRAKEVTWSTHCHNDLGLATANTLSAVSAGARQVEVTMNGIGERAGNTALEEVVMTLSTRPAMFPVRLIGLDTTQITRTSRIVSQLTGSLVQPNKAIVGANAFAHEAGIHQDGMLKNKSTYEIMTPASVGLTRSSLVLGKHSGRAAYAQRLKELGFDIDAKTLDGLVEKFKALADEKKVVTDADLQSIVISGMSQPEPVWTLESLHVTTGVNLRPTATVTMRRKGTTVEMAAAALGSGPIDAVYNAIKNVVKVPNDLVHFSVQSVTDGQNALGEVTIRITRAEAGEGKRQVKGLKQLKQMLQQHQQQQQQTDKALATTLMGGGVGITAPLHHSAAAAGMGGGAGAGGTQQLQQAGFSSQSHAAAAAASGSSNSASGVGRVSASAAARAALERIDPTLFQDSAGEGASAAKAQFTGVYADRDIIVAAAHAYVSALNRLIAAETSGNHIRGAGEGGGV